MLKLIKESDLVIALGGRLSEIASQSYTLFDIPKPQMAFVHVHPGRRRSAASIRRIWPSRRARRLLSLARGRAAAAGHRLGRRREGGP